MNLSSHPRHLCQYHLRKMVWAFNDNAKTCEITSHQKDLRKTSAIQSCKITWWCICGDSNHQPACHCHSPLLVFPLNSVTTTHPLCGKWRLWPHKMIPQIYKRPLRGAVLLPLSFWQIPPPMCVDTAACQRWNRIPSWLCAPPARSGPHWNTSEQQQRQKLGASKCFIIIFFHLELQATLCLCHRNAICWTGWWNLERQTLIIKPYRVVKAAWIILVSPWWQSHCRDESSILLSSNEKAKTRSFPILMPFIFQIYSHLIRQIDCDSILTLLRPPPLVIRVE